MSNIPGTMTLEHRLPVDPKQAARDDIENRFDFHPATDEEKRNAHTSIRHACKELALFLEERLPAGREKASAITRLEETMFWANAAIARARGVEK